MRKVNQICSKHKTIHFCMFLFLAVLALNMSVNELHAQENDELKMIVSHARQGDAEAQYVLGIMFLQGKKLKTDYKEAYAWLSLANQQNIEDADIYLQKASEKLSKEERDQASFLAKEYNKKYVLPYKIRFIINVNGTEIGKSASISPSIPIYMTFHHTNPAVTKIRMGHPQNPALSKTFSLGEKHRIINHEQHMKSGHVSTSEFLALDDQGRIYNKIIISFLP